MFNGQFWELNARTFTHHKTNMKCEFFGRNLTALTPETAQRQFRSVFGGKGIEMDNAVANMPFSRVTEGFSPKYSEYDNSGAADESDFATPKPSFIQSLKLQSKGPWSRLFADEKSEPTFVDWRAGFHEACVISFDLLRQFAAAKKLRPVWRVWVEKVGGNGTGNSFHIANSTFLT